MDIEKYNYMLLTARNKFMILPKILEDYKKELKEEYIKEIIILAEDSHIPVSSGGEMFNEGVALMCESACEVIERS